MTSTISLHQTRYGRGTYIEAMKPGSWASFSVGSRRYESIVRAWEGVGQLERLVKSSENITLRVVNSLGPFFSGSNRSFMRVGKRVP